MLLPFEEEYRKKYYALLDEVFESNFWSEGKMIKKFEKKFSDYVGIGSRTISNGGTGLLAILEYINVKDCEVIVPTNTFWATALSVKKAGGNVVYGDCNRDDLCLSYNDMKSKVTVKTKAVIVVHIGGHIAFEIDKIAEFCKENNIYLIEDCAHAHGADWNGKMAGSWGFAGSYSFYATKTMPLGEGGMVVSRNEEFLEWLVKFRNYGKEVLEGSIVTYPITDGFNYRMNEFTAALGIIQLDRLPRILEWKRCLAEKYDKIFTRTVKFPEGMVSGYYKYIVFDYELNEETGKVFNNTDFGHIIDGVECELPNSSWVAEHHKCVPIYYGWTEAGKTEEQLKKLLLDS